MGKTKQNKPTKQKNKNNKPKHHQAKKHLLMKPNPNWLTTITEKVKIKIMNTSMEEQIKL